MFERVDGHVLRAVIGEDPADVRKERDRDEVAEQEREAEDALSDVLPEGRWEDRAQQPGGYVRDADEEHERDDEADADERRATGGRGLLVARELDVGRAHEHAHAVAERLPEDKDSTDEWRARRP